MVEANPPAANYEVPFTYRKVFNTEQITEMLNAFKAYDANQNGNIDAAEFKQALNGMGHTELTDDEVNALLKGVDKNMDGTIDWLEYLDMMQHVKKSGNQTLSQAIATKRGQATETATQGGGHSTYLLEEVSMIARTINRLCKDDPLLQDGRLPINPENDDLFTASSDGMVMTALINQIEKDLIDYRTVNQGQNLSIFKVRENLDQAFSVAKTLIKIVGVDTQTFLDKDVTRMLGVLWQLVRLATMKTITLSECKEIYRLLNEGEELGDLQKLKPEDILIRWMNFHLNKAGQEPISNLGRDLVDSKKCIYVLNQLDPEHCSLDALEEADDLTRATKMIESSKAMGVEDVIGPSDLLKGNTKVNSVFVAAIFNTKHGLEELT